MVKALEAARKAARRAQEAAYEGKCTIIEFCNVGNEKTGLSEEEEVIVTENQPCRLSFEKLDVASQTETAAAVSQVVKLFLAPEANVKAGSKVVVKQNGVTGEYSASGIPAVYSTHQEIVLELWEGWA